MSSTIELRPPEAVRGMTKLEKEKFNLTMDFPILEIEGKDMSVVGRRVRLEPYLIGHKLKPIKNLMDSETPGRKYLIFNPEKVADETTKTKIIGLLENELGQDKGFKWKTISKDLTFDNWDSKTLIKSVLPENLDYSSFTQTGHIIHCNFADETLPYRFVIAEILLNKVNKCRTVVQKGTIISNVYRNLELDLLAGEEDYITELKEEGLRFKLDFSKVYWNSRLSGEHARLISTFNSDTIVYDACCGIGPFVLPAVVKRKPFRVIANDLNPDSIKWLKENVKLNKIKAENIEIHNIDANEFIKTIVADDALRIMTTPTKESTDEADNVVRKHQIHVVMNLPAYAVNFLPAFRGILKNKIDNIPKDKLISWNVHCYLFAKSHVDVPDEWYEEEARRMVDEKLQWTTSLVKSCHKVRTVSSRKEMFCVDISISYEYLTSDPIAQTEIQYNDDEPEEPTAKKTKI